LRQPKPAFDQNWVRACPKRILNVIAGIKSGEPTGRFL
jgi:hypothetical protein